MFITVGDAGPLAPQTKEFAGKLSENGVEHTALFWTGTGANLEHDYIYEMHTVQAQKAFEMLIRFIAERSYATNG